MAMDDRLKAASRNVSRRRTWSASDIRFEAGKLRRTIRICFCIMMARTFGNYICSGWDGLCGYAQYEWRGREWRIPNFDFLPEDKK